MTPPVSNDMILGSVTQLREDIGTWRKETNDKLDGVCTQVGLIEVGRAAEAAVARERASVATRDEHTHAAQAADERHMAADLVVAAEHKDDTNLLTRHWRITLLSGIGVSIGLSLLNFALGR